MQRLSAMTQLTFVPQSKKPFRMGRALANQSNLAELPALTFRGVNRHILHSAVVPPVEEVDDQSD